MAEIKMRYDGGKLLTYEADIKIYCDDFFDWEIETESELFYELRKANGWNPHRLRDSSNEELEEIKQFFNKNKNTFYFLREQGELAGSILFIGNNIQSLCIAKKFQRQGFGSLLTSFAVNQILLAGYNAVELTVFVENTPAIKMYENLGFRII